MHSCAKLVAPVSLARHRTSGCVVVVRSSARDGAGGGGKDDGDAIPSVRVSKSDVHGRTSRAMPRRGRGGGPRARRVTPTVRKIPVPVVVSDDVSRGDDDDGDDEGVRLVKLDEAGGKAAPAPASFEESVELNKEIMACVNWESLSRLIEREAGRMSAVNVSTAYGRLGKFKDPRTRRMASYEALERAATLRMGEMSARSVTQVVWACGHLQRGKQKSGGDAFWERLETRVLEQTSKLAPQGVSNVCWAYARLEQKMPNEMRDAFEAYFLKHSGKFKAGELSIMFWAMTKFGDRPSMEFMSTFERKMSNWFNFCRTQELANMIAAYARIKGCGTPEFLHSVAQESFLTLRAFKNAEFGMLLWGLSNAEYFLEEDEAQMIFHEAKRRAHTLNAAEVALVAGSFATFSDANTVGVRDNEIRSFTRFEKSTKEALSAACHALEESFSQLLPKANCDDLSYVIWAFAHLSHRPSEEFVRRFEDRALSMIDYANPQNLANMMYGASTLKLNTITLMTHISFCVLEKLDSFSAVEIFMVCSALANSGHDPGPEMMLKLESASVRLMDTFNPAGVTEFLRVFARLRYMCSEESFTAIGERCEIMSEKFDSYTMGMTLWSYATLCKQPCDSMIQRFTDELQGSMRPFKGQDYGLALWSLVLLGTLDNASKHVYSLTRALVALNADVLSSADGLSSDSLCALYMARLVTIGTPYEALVLNATANIEEDCKRAWLLMKTQDPTISKLQTDVALVLEELQIPFELEAPVEGGLIRPDIVIAEHRVALEVDGPHHYSYDALGQRHVLGPTVMRDKLLESWGWRVCTLPYHEWTDLITTREKRAYLNRLLSKYMPITAKDDD